MAGRPRTPTSVLQLQGTWRADRHAGRVLEPAEALGDPPRHLEPPEAAAWREVASGAAAAWLRASDRPMLELFSRLMAASRADFSGISAAKLAILANVSAQLGLGPVARARVHAAAETSLDPADEFFN